LLGPLSKRGEQRARRVALSGRLSLRLAARAMKLRAMKARACGVLSGRGPWLAGLLLLSGACSVEERSLSDAPLGEGGDVSGGAGGGEGVAGASSDGALAAGPGVTQEVAPLRELPDQLNVPAAGAGGTSDAGVGTVDGGAGELPPATLVVGKACSSDAACIALGIDPLRAHCILPSSDGEFGTGGPQGGYCSARCQRTEDCSSIDSIAVCGLIDDATGVGFCLRLCQPGEGGLKCEAVLAQACVQLPALGPELGVCFPMCQSDAACGPDRFCNLGGGDVTGLCGAEPPVGGDVGAPCTGLTQASDCKSGLCVDWTAADGVTVFGSFCSAPCTYGLVAGCGYDAVTAVPREASCNQAQLAGGVAGDIGFCFELCDTATDCTQAGWLCAPFTATDQALTGRRGQCLPPESL
jgi:hypothetical protein